nr:hypothetical protein [Tanacetum cinerariifolium]
MHYQWELSSGNAFAPTVGKCTSSGIFITSSENDLEHFIPNTFGHERLDVFGAFVISRRNRVLCYLNLTFHYFRRRRGSRNRGSFVCISTSSGDNLPIFLWLVTVLLGRVPEPEDEASQLTVEESRLDEPELGNPGLDKLVLDKLEAGFIHD